MRPRQPGALLRISSDAFGVDGPGAIGPTAENFRSRARAVADFERAQLRRIYRWAFFLRASIGLTAWLLVSSGTFPVLEDSLYYEQVGAGVAADWLAGNSSVWLTHAMASGSQPWLLVAVIAGFYYMLGGIRALPLLIVLYSCVTAFTPVLTYHIGKIVGLQPRSARFGAWLVVISPCFAFWAGTLYKEGLILLLLNLIVYHALRLQHGFRPRSLLILAVSLPLFYALRFYLAIIVSAAIGMALLFARSPRGRRVGSSPIRFFRQLALVACLVAGVLALGMGGQVQKIMPADVAELLERVGGSRNDLSHAASGYLPDLDLSTPTKVIEFLPIGTAYFLSVPLPWHIGRLRQNLTIPETFFWLCLYPLILSGMLRGMRTNSPAATLLLMVTVTTTMFYSIFVGNIGTAYRMRSQVWLLWAVFAAWGWEWRQLRKQRKPRVDFDQPPVPA
jgi:hypothetical protein